MAKYRITSPTGETFEITAPDDATEDQVIAYAKQQFSAQPAPAAPAQPQTPPAPEVNTGADMAKSFGTGLIKGTTGIATLPATAGQLAGHLGAPEWLSNGITRVAGAAFGQHVQQPKYNDMMKAIEDKTGPLYKPQTTAGEYAQTAGEFVPGGLGPGGIGRKAVNVLAPAIASETAGQLTKGTDVEGIARLAGALAGGALPALGRRAVTPFPNLDPEHARLVQVLDNEGVRLTAGDRTGSKAVRWAESAANDVPFAGQRIGAEKAAQGEDFTAAILRRVGQTGDRRVTGPIVDAAFTRIGRDFDSLASNNVMRSDGQLVSDLRSVVNDYRMLVPEATRAPIVDGIVNDLFATLRRTPQISGQMYQSFRSRFDRMARSARQDPQLSDTLFGIRNAIDDAMERNMTQADARAWREARNQYRNMLVVEKLATQANADAAQGIIKPQALLAAVAGQNRRDLARGHGDFADLAKAGRAVLQELPQSGTAPRLAAMQMLNIFGGTMAGLPGAIASQTGQTLGARALMSAPVQRYLSNQTMARAIQNARAQTPWPLIAGAAAPRGLLSPEEKR